jgi:SEC-C motif-containing protein/Armadillo/beta-catenin-like repeat-containing protein
MLFVPESILKARQALYEQVQAGKLTRAQAFQQALELDPFDAMALIVLGQERYEARDLPGAAEYCWRAAGADPCRAEAWFTLSGSLLGESQELRNGITELAARKTLRDPEGLAHFKERFKNKPIASDFTDGEEFLEFTAEQFGGMRSAEPENVSERLRPYRLLDDLLEESADGLAAELVDAILADSARCGPPLIGVLRAMATGSLPGGDPSPIVSSLALLGEIGDPEVLPELVECLSVEDEDVQQAAQWAVRRIASRRPEASLAAIRTLASTADADNRCALTIALGEIPGQPGKRDVLLSLLDGLAGWPQSDRHEIFINVAVALAISEGAKGRELAWSLLSRHAAVLPKRTRAELRDALKVQEELARIALTPADGPEATVYDLCCQPWEDDEDDAEEEGGPMANDKIDDQDFIPAPIHRRGNRGRNDPCWCGSGKKYKKCHLESDEKSQPAPAGPQETPLVADSHEEAALRKRLIEFATGGMSKGELAESLKMFVGPDPPAGADEQTLSMEIVDWVIHDYASPRLGHPIIQEFLKRSPGDLTTRQRQILEAWSRARFSIYEVLEVRAGSGVQLKDLLADGEFFVYDVNTANRAAPWDCYLARVEEFEGRRHFTATVLTIPQPLVAPLKEWAIEERQRSGQNWDAFLHSHSHLMRQEASRLINRAGQPARMVSYEGDELVFSKARYVVLDEQAVRREFDRSRVLLRPEDGADYGWLDEAEDENGGRRAYGHIHIAGGELTLECNSRERLERGKALLRDLAGGYLRHLGDDFTPWQSAMRDRKESPNPPQGSGF